MTQTVNMGNTTTALASSVNPSGVGQNVTYTATVTATAPASGTRTGTVNFQDGGVSIAGCGAQAVSVAGTATCVISYAGPGSHTITAVYSGDANFNPSTSPNLTQTVNKGNTITAVNSSVNPSVVGSERDLHGHGDGDGSGIGDSDGNRQLPDGGITIAGCGAQPLSVAGTATCTVSYAVAGSHTISGVYGGDANFNTSTSPNLTQTVSKDSTTTALGSSVNPSVSGQSVTFTATVTANPPGAGTPTGTVTFQDGGVDIAGCVNQALVAGTATCAVTYAGAGSHSITAIYSGDADFLTSTSAPLTQTVNKDATTTALSSSVNPSVSGQSVTFTATVTANPPGAGTPTGTVTFQDGGVDIAGCVNQALVAGTRHLRGDVRRARGATASPPIYSGDADFLTSTSAPLTQTVNQDATTTALSSSVNPSVSGQSVTFTATVTANPPGAGTPTGTVDLPGRRGRHRRLRRPGPGRRHRDLHGDVRRGGQPHHHRDLQRGRRLPDQHLGAARPDRQQGRDHDRAELLGQPLGLGPECDLHRDGDRQPAGRRDTDRDGDLPGRRGRHRRLRQPGPGRRQRHLRGDVRRGGEPQHHRRSTAGTPTS